MAYRSPRVFGDKFGDKFGEQFGDSLNLVINLVILLVTYFVSRQVCHNFWWHIFHSFWWPTKIVTWFGDLFIIKFVTKLIHQIHHQIVHKLFPHILWHILSPYSFHQNCHKFNHYICHTNWLFIKLVTQLIFHFSTKLSQWVSPHRPLKRAMA